MEHVKRGKGRPKSVEDIQRKTYALGGADSRFLAATASKLGVSESLLLRGILEGVRSIKEDTQGEDETAVLSN